MADTLTLPVDRIQAVLEECPELSGIVRDGILARLRTYNQRPAVDPIVRADLVTTYVLANVDSSFTFPKPTEDNEFNRINWEEGSPLPYEFQQQIVIPHMVVVTGDTADAINFFDLLMAQNGLEIPALEFLILTNYQDNCERHLHLQAAEEELEGTALKDWAGESNSIKIIPEETTVTAQVERHVRFLVNSNVNFGNIRRLDDTNRVPPRHRDDRVRVIVQNGYNDAVRRELERRRRQNRVHRSRSRSPIAGYDSETDSA